MLLAMFVVKLGISVLCIKETRLITENLWVGIQDTFSHNAQGKAKFKSDCASENANYSKPLIIAIMSGLQEIRLFVMLLASNVNVY